MWCEVADDELLFGEQIGKDVAIVWISGATCSLKITHLNSNKIIVVTLAASVKFIIGSFKYYRVGWSSWG